jgi:hypothetical protein
MEATLLPHRTLNKQLVSLSVPVIMETKIVSITEALNRLWELQRPPAIVLFEHKLNRGTGKAVTPNNTSHCAMENQLHILHYRSPVQATRTAKTAAAVSTVKAQKPGRRRYKPEQTAMRS